MSNIRVFLGVTIVFIQGIIATATPLRIGAFNLQVFGATKASENSTVSVYSKVRMYTLPCMCSTSSIGRLSLRIPNGSLYRIILIPTPPLPHTGRPYRRSSRRFIQCHIVVTCRLLWSAKVNHFISLYFEARFIWSDGVLNYVLPATV